MKLYTEEQVRNAYIDGYYDCTVGEDSHHNSYQCPNQIELPSDDEMANASNHCKDGQVKIGFLRGVLWLKEQILNQNK
jgi:hypothetical protein